MSRRATWKHAVHSRMSVSFISSFIVHLTHHEHHVQKKKRSSLSGCALSLRPQRGRLFQRSQRKTVLRWLGLRHRAQVDRGNWTRKRPTFSQTETSSLSRQNSRHQRHPRHFCPDELRRSHPQRVLRTTAQLREGPSSTGAKRPAQEALASGLKKRQNHHSAWFSKHTTSLLDVHNSACLKHSDSLKHTKQGMSQTAGHMKRSHFGLQSSRKNTCAEHLCLVGSTNPCPTILIGFFAQIFLSDA